MILIYPLSIKISLDYIISITFWQKIFLNTPFIFHVETLDIFYILFATNKPYKMNLILSKNFKAFPNSKFSVSLT